MGVYSLRFFFSKKGFSSVVWNIYQNKKKCVAWNVAVQRRRQRAVTVSKERRELLVWAKRLCTNGDEEHPILEAQTNKAVEELKSTVQYQ